MASPYTLASVPRPSNATNWSTCVATLTCPPVADRRISLTPNGNIRYALKTPHRDGTTRVVLDPMDFVARLAALVPPPRVNLTRYHGVLAPPSRLRGQITAASRGRGCPTI